MKKIVSCVVAMSLLFTSISIAEENQMSLGKNAKTIADTLTKNYGVTSIQYALIDNGEIKLSGNSGVFSKNENKVITNESIYGIGSVSKMFSTTAVMTLFDKGLIDIDKPITNYIPEFRMTDKRYIKITPRMLMNHSSGMYGTHYEGAFLFDDSNTKAHDTLLKKLSEQTLKSNPGEVYEYCNDGFTLMEILVERVSKMSYSNYLSKYVTEPLEMSHTKSPRDKFDSSQQVNTYLPMYKEALPIDTVNILGTGGMRSTAEDLCKFEMALMGKNPNVLSKKASDMMQNEEYKKGLWSYDNDEGGFYCGLGWDSVKSYPFDQYGIKALTKTGDTMLYKSVIVAIPKYNIAMAVNASGGSSSFNYVFAANVLQSYLKNKGIIETIVPQKLASVPVKKMMPKELERLSGTYVTNNSEEEVNVKEGILTTTEKQGNTIVTNSFTYIGNNTFASKDSMTKYQIVTLKDGETYIKMNICTEFPNVGQNVRTKYSMQKLEPIKVNPDVLSIWNKRAGKHYWMVSEPASSQFYLLGSSFVDLRLKTDFSNGYAYGGSKIVNENFAVNTLKFRDVSDLTFFNLSGKEYLKLNDFIYVEENGMKILSAKTNIKLNSRGYSEYYKFDKGDTGKTMKVSLAKGTSFAVYDKKGVCTNFSTVSRHTEVKISQESVIAFIGKANSEFEVNIK